MTEIAALGLKVEGVEGIDRAAASIDKLTTAADKAESAGDGLSSAFKAFTANQERMISSLSSVEGHLSEISKGMAKIGTSAKDVAPASQAMQALDVEALDVVKSLNAIGVASKESGAAAAASFAAFAAQQEKTTASVDGLSTSFKELSAEQQKNAAAFAAMNSSLTKISQSLSQSGDAARKSSDEVKGLRASYESLRAGYDPAYAASQKYTSATDTLNTALSKGAITSKEHSEATAMAKKEYDSASTSAGGLKGSLTTLSASLAAVGVGFSVGAVKSFAQAVFEASAAAERLRISLDFSSALGSGAEIEYLRKTTQALGLEFSSTAKAYQSFSAATRGTALEGAKTRDVFESISKASAVMGLSAENTSGVLLALQQMVSKGTVASEELRGQLGERLPGAFATAARAMGVTTAELGKMLEQGQVVADDFLPKFAAELTKSMGDAAEKAADRLDAAVNKANNAWDRFKQNVGDSGVSSAMAETSSRWAGSLDAISIAMEQARAEGAGFWGQMAAAAGTVQTMTTMTGALTVNMYGNAKATAEAEKELARLQKIADTQGNSAWLLKEMGNVRRYIGELQQARREKESLTGSATTSAYTEGMGNSKTIVREREKDTAAEKYLGELRMKNAGINKSYNETLTQLEKLLEENRIQLPEYIKLVSELAQTTWDSSTAGKDAAKTSKAGAGAIKAEQTAFQNLIATIKEKIKVNNAEMFNAGALTESQKLRIQLEAKLEAGSKKMTDAHQKEVKGLIAKLKEQEDFEKAAKRAITLNDARIASEEEMNRAMADMDRQVTQVKLATFEYSQSIADQIEMTELETKTIGMNAQARQVLIEQLRIEQDLRKRRQAINDAPFASDEARNAALSALDEAGAKSMALAQRKVYVAEWEKTSELIGDTLADYIMGGGKDAATYLKRLFATLVLQPVVKYGVQGALNSLGMGQGQGGASSGSATGIPGGGLTDWSSWGSTASGWASDASFKLVTNGWEDMGSSMLGLSRTITSVDTYLKDIPGMSGGIGSAAGYLGAIYSLSQGKIGSAAGTAIGNYLLPGIGTMIGGVLGGLLDGLDDSGTKHMGAGAIYSAAGGLQTGAGIYNQATFGLGHPDEYSEAMQSGVSEITKGLAQTLDAFSVAFGKTAGYSVATAFADDSSKDGAWGSLKIADEVGKVLVDWGMDRESKFAPREFSDGEAGYKEYLNAVAVDVKNAFVAMDLPAWADQILTTANDIDTLNTALQQISTIKTAFEGLGQSMTIFSDLTGEVQTRLLNASGGIESLVSSAGAFYQGFYTEGERAIAQREQQMNTLSGLGLYIDPGQGNDAKELFRKTVEEAMSSGQTELAAKLLLMNQSFSESAGYWQQVLDDSAEETTRTIEKAQAAAKAVADERYSLESTYLQLVGETDELRARELSTLDASNRELQKMIWARQDEAEAAAKAAQKMADTQRAIDSVTSGFSGLRETITLDQLGTDEAKYGYFKAQADSLTRMLPQLQDQEAIARAVNEIQSLTSRAYGSLDEAQKIEMGDEFLQYLAKTEDLALKNIERTNKEQADATGKAVGDAVSKEVSRIVDAIARIASESGAMSRETVEAIRRISGQTGNTVVGTGQKYAEVNA